MVKRKSHSLVHYNTLNRIDNLSFDNNIVAFMEQHWGLFWNMIRAVLGACHLVAHVGEWIYGHSRCPKLDNKFPWRIYWYDSQQDIYCYYCEVTSFFSSAEALCCRCSVQFTYRAESLMVQWLRFLKWNSSSYICRNENKYFDAQAFVLTAKATTGSKSCTVNTRSLHYFLPRHFFFQK